MRRSGETGHKMERREERRKKVGKDGQIDRQTAQRGRLTSPLPAATQHPRPGSWLLGSHLQRWTETDS